MGHLMQGVKPRGQGLCLVNTEYLCWAMLSQGNTDCAGCPVDPHDDPGDVRQDQAGSILPETPEKVALVTSGGLGCFGLKAKGGTIARQGLLFKMVTKMRAQDGSKTAGVSHWPWAWPECPRAIRVEELWPEVNFGL